jgi:hypothetical protein
MRELNRVSRKSRCPVWCLALVVLAASVPAVLALEWPVPRRDLQPCNTNFTPTSVQTRTAFDCETAMNRAGSAAKQDVQNQAATSCPASCPYPQPSSTPHVTGGYCPDRLPYTATVWAEGTYKCTSTP